MQPTQEIPKPEIIEQLMEWFYLIPALRAAIDLQIWEKINNGEDTAEKIATQEGWDLAGLRALLDAICSLKLLSQEGERYSLVPEAAYYLLPSKPAYKGNMVLNEYHWEGDGRLAEAVRSGKRPIQYNATTSDVAGLWIANYSRSWAYPESFLEFADQLWDSVDVQAHDGLRVMDIACGPAPRSLALGRKHPGVRLTWLDWEQIIQVALTAAAQLEVASQVSVLAGNLWELDFGRSLYDVAFLGNVTHFFNADENTRLFRKVHSALAPGGTIIINSVARRESEMAHVAGVWLYAASASGGVYNFNEYKGMLKNAGFHDIQDINQGPIKAVKG